MAAGCCNHFLCPLFGDIDIPFTTCLISKIITLIFSYHWAVSSIFMCILWPCKQMNKIQQENCGGSAGIKGWLAF